MEEKLKYLPYDAVVCDACGIEHSGGKNTLVCTWNPGKCAACGSDTHVTKFRNFAFTKKLPFQD